MKKKDRLEEKYQKMNVRFNELHREAKHLKQEMVKLRATINNTSSTVEERDDELALKHGAI